VAAPVSPPRHQNDSSLSLRLSPPRV